ncbi:MAG: hypothetical protein HGA65_19990 [Oscillochloris sp.]|nr:hypothetical protein [Oscillochloris sp.]
MRFGNFIGGIFGLSVAVLVVFGLLRWLGVPTGALLDWVIGLTSAWWLFVVVTIPWNIHFGARNVLVEAAESRTRGISVAPTHVAYAQRWVRWSLFGAIGLHLASAIGLYVLAASGVSAIGYLGSAVALLLTGLRPAIAGYTYVSGRLSAISAAVRHPREDVVTLRNDLQGALARLQAVECALDLETIGSFAQRQTAALEDLRQHHERLRLAYAELQSTNAAEHARLAREAAQAVAQITVDGQVLDHVREIVRFFKNA